MGIQNMLDEREAEADPLRMSAVCWVAVELLEQMRDGLRWNTKPAVLDSAMDSAVSTEEMDPQKLSLAGILDRVGNQVRECLTYGVGVGVNV